MCDPRQLQQAQASGVPPDIQRAADVPPSALKQLTQAAGKQLPSGQATIKKK